MGEDSSHADRSSATLPGRGSYPLSPFALESQELLIPSFSPSSAPSSPIHTLSRLGSKTPASPSSPGGQVSAITVVALLDKLVNMMEAAQESQRRMERKQADLEGAVRGVQGDVTRLTKSHTSTSNSVAKLLERSRKTAGHVKEVRERMDRQAAQVKRLEANHAHLLKRNHFKVLIFQEDNELPSTVFMKDPAPAVGPSSSLLSQDEGPAPAPTPATDANRSHEEGLQTISLSSDEEEDEAVAAASAAVSPRAEQHEEAPFPELHEEDFAGLGSGERTERSRAEKLKRSSLKKVDSLKKAFSRQSIEKKINRIVPPERREKIKKSFTPHHPKSPSAKSSSFRVSPITFNVKKVRGGEEAPPQPGASPTGLTPVEMPPLGGPDGELPLAEVHSQEERSKLEEPQSPSTTGSVDGGLSVTEEPEHALSATLAEEETLPERDEEDEEDEEDDNDNDEEGEEASPVVAASPVPAVVAMQQAS